MSSARRRSVQSSTCSRRLGGCATRIASTTSSRCRDAAGGAADADSFDRAELCYSSPRTWPTGRCQRCVPAGASRSGICPTANVTRFESSMGWSPTCSTIPNLGGRQTAAEDVAGRPGAVDRARHNRRGSASPSVEPRSLAHEPDELARQARLVEPLPRAGRRPRRGEPGPRTESVEDRRRMSRRRRPAGPPRRRPRPSTGSTSSPPTHRDVARWRRDRLLHGPRTTSTERKATWPLASGGTLCELVVPKRAMPGLELTFDADSLPWHTVCTVTGPDQPGTLGRDRGSSPPPVSSCTLPGCTTDRRRVADRFTLDRPPSGASSTPRR